jgi:hypothetical protein
MFAVAGVATVPAQATAYTSDQSNLWFSTSNLGWGVQLTEKGPVIFAALYVYDDAGTAPNWYVATLAPQSTPSAWAGNLYATAGPWLGPPPSNLDGLGLRKVGTMRWQGAGYYLEPGMLTYSVDGQSMTEKIIRETGNIVDEYSGRYAAARTWTDSCDGSFEDTVELAIAQSPPVINIAWRDQVAGVDCRFSGNLEQEPTYGNVTGAYSCGSENGKSKVFEMLVLGEKFTARWTSDANDKGCHVEGELTAVRRR